MSLASSGYKKSFVNSNIWVGIGNALLASKGILLLPLLVKNLGTSSYGAFTLLMSTVTILLNISNLGTGYRYKRYMPAVEGREERSAIFYFQFIFQAVIIIGFGTALIGAPDLLATWLLKESIQFSPVLVAVLLVLSFLNYQVGGYFRLTGRMKFFTLAQAGVPYVEILILAAAMLSGVDFSINFILSANIAALILISFPLSLKLIKEIGFAWPEWKLDDIRTDLLFGLPMLASLLVDFFLSTSDRYIINYFLSSREVGLYSPAYSLGTFIRFIPSIYIYVMPVYLSKLVDGGLEDEAKRMVNWSLKLFFVVSIPFVCGAALFGKPVLELFANKDVASASAYVLPIVAVATVFYGLNVIIGEILFLKLKTKRILFANGISAAVNISLNIVLIPIFRDINVAAMTTLVGYLVAFIAMRREIRSVPYFALDVPFALKVAMVSVLAAAAAYGMTVIGLEERTGMILSLTVYIGVLSLLYYGTGIFGKRELQELRTVLSKRKEIK
jgi:O-antigen/teichoic acid export membrane protein